MLDPAQEPDLKVQEVLQRLQAWGATTAYPLVMHLLALREGGVAEPGDVTEALCQLLPPQPYSAGVQTRMAPCSRLPQAK